MSNREAQSFIAELRMTLLAIEDLGGEAEMLNLTRQFCRMRERVAAVEFEALPVGRGVVCAPSVGFILDDLGMLDAWRN